MLQIEFSLQQQRLDIEYRVSNPGMEPVRFTIGSHPAFQLPGAIEDNCIRFSDPETLHRYGLTDDGLLHVEGKPFPIADQQIPLTRSLFDDDALVFKDIRSHHISLFNHEQELLRVHTGGAPHLGLWAKPAAPYVCIEPWFGYSDGVDASGKWQDKPALLTVEPGSTFTHRWAIDLVSISR